MSQEQRASVKDCPKYLEALPIPAAVKQSALLLFKLGGRGPPETSPGASPRLDGFPLLIYSSFSAFFSPLMLNIIQSAEESGLFPEASGKGVIRCIPNRLDAMPVDKLRPIALQQLKKSGL